MSGPNSNESEKSLNERLWKIKYPAGKEKAESFESLQSRYEALRGPKTQVSLDELNSRFSQLEGAHCRVGESDSGTSISHNSGHMGPDNSDEDVGIDEDDDFMSFIADSLSKTASDCGSHSPVMTSCIPPSINESHLLETERKVQTILKGIEQHDQLSHMESQQPLHNSAVSVFLASNISSSNASSDACPRHIPNKDKTELDWLIEQTRDEARLLRRHHNHPPVIMSESRTRPVDNLEDSCGDDQIRALVMAAQDAAYLENKYGGQISNTKKTTTNRKNSSDNCASGGKMNHVVQNKRRSGDDEDDDSDGSRSYGSNISDESSLGDSD